MHTLILLDFFGFFLFCVRASHSGFLSFPSFSLRQADGVTDSSHSRRGREHFCLFHRLMDYVVFNEISLKLENKFKPMFLFRFFFSSSLRSSCSEVCPRGARSQWTRSGSLSDGRAETFQGDERGSRAKPDEPEALGVD